MRITQIKENCLYISDLDQSEWFYNGLLNLPLISKVAGRHIFFRAGSSVLLCFVAEKTKADKNLPPHYAYGKQHLAFEVAKEDYQKTKEQFKKHNIPITHEQSWSDNLRSFYFEDPDGHVLEVVQCGIWGD